MLEWSKVQARPGLIGRDLVVVEFASDDRGSTRSARVDDEDPACLVLGLWIFSAFWYQH